MRKEHLSRFTKSLIRANEEEIKQIRFLVTKKLHEIEELKKQNRELKGRA